MKYINICCAPSPDVMSVFETTFRGTWEKNYYIHNVSDELDTYFFASVGEVEIFLREGYVGELLRCIYANTTYIVPGSLYGIGDIILPNAFTASGKNPIFSEYAVSPSYDIDAFHVFFHGIVTQDINPDSEDDHYDVYDPHAYDFMNACRDIVGTESRVAIFEFREGTMSPKHLPAILDMVMQEGSSF